MEGFPKQGFPFFSLSQLHYQQYGFVDRLNFPIPPHRTAPHPATPLLYLNTYNAGVQNMKSPLKYAVTSQVTLNGKGGKGGKEGDIVW